MHFFSLMIKSVTHFIRYTCLIGLLVLENNLKVFCLAESQHFTSKYLVHFKFFQHDQACKLSYSIQLRLEMFFSSIKFSKKLFLNLRFCNSRKARNFRIDLRSGLHYITLLSESRHAMVAFFKTKKKLFVIQLLKKKFFLYLTCIYQSGQLNTFITCQCIAFDYQQIVNLLNIE